MEQILARDFESLEKAISSAVNTEISTEIRQKLCEKIRAPEESKASRGLDKKAAESLLCPVQMLDLKALAVVNRSIETHKLEATSALISNETMLASTNNTTDASVPRTGSRDTLRKEEELVNPDD